MLKCFLFQKYEKDHANYLKIKDSDLGLIISHEIVLCEATLGDPNVGLTR